MLETAQQDEEVLQFAANAVPYVVMETCSTRYVSEFMMLLDSSADINCRTHIQLIHVGVEWIVYDMHVYSSAPVFRGFSIV